ncbi:MAG: FkbM family methyltransferase, partial [Hyphomonas sp.]
MLPIADVSWLNLRHRFPALIDIGANDGAFAGYLVRVLSIPRTIAVEPLPAHAPALRGRGFEVHSVALGNPVEPGDVAFQVSEADAASSLLPVTQRCLDEYPQVKLAETIRVPLRRLDDLIAP